MDIRLKNGNFLQNPNGLPKTVSGLEELLQRGEILLRMKKGSLPYHRELGSGLWQLDPGEEHWEERAAALANEALLGLGGVEVESAEKTETGAVFHLATPLGKGDVEIGDL